MLSKKFDVIIIGGGMAGVHAAYPIVMAGFNVALLDGGVESDSPIEEWHNDNFEEIRKNRADQHTLFLGKNLSAISLTAKNHAASMTSGSRAYISKYTEKKLPLAIENATILQSLAKGGLGEAWGAVCELYDDEELKVVGLPVEQMKVSYQEVIDRIGVSGERKGYTLQPPVVQNMHTSKILQKYNQNKWKFSQDNIFVTQSALAVLTKKQNKRQPTTYNDMDFWSNKGLAIFRPSIIIDELIKEKNFTYIPNIVVSQIKEHNRESVVVGETFDNKNVTVKGNKIIVAAGSINSTRILLKSYSLYNKKVPFLYKQNILIPALHLATINPDKTKKQLSFCQTVMINMNKIQGLSKFYVQMYSYKSLLLHKLLNYIPLPAQEALTFLSIFTPYMMLIDVRFPNDMQGTAFLELKMNGAKDYLKIHPSLSKKMYANMYYEITNVKKTLRKLNLLPLKTVFPEKGATAHYAGGIPFENERTAIYPLLVDARGKLNRGKNIYVADASSWLALPAKPHSLTIMAQANLVGKNVIQDLS